MRRIINNVKAAIPEVQQIKISLPDDVKALLDKWAAKGKRPTASLVAYLVERSLSEAIERGDYKPDESGEIKE